MTSGETYVVATAGHVDHGKSTLVRTLTGINPDRLREEQEREMTIDLGFAWLALPDGSSVGLVDVPGHIDFIENMLAGVGGVDAALLVVAADEGPMPQTREHLAILDLLRVPRAVVALTKADLAPDAEWLQLIAADVQRLLDGTHLAGSPVAPVSARTGQGIAELLSALQTTLRGSGRQRDLGRPRLPIDRVFSVAGFGTVVTGTLLGGGFAVGDEVEVLPQRLASRVRGLQTHKQKLDLAQPGSRVAINLAGVPVEQLARGNVVARPGLLRPTTLLDVRLELLPRAAFNPSTGSGQALQPSTFNLLKHNAEVKLFTGAAETVARVRLLEGGDLAAGQDGWAQLELAAPVAVAEGDRFIVRLPSPSITLGGGAVVDPNPVSRYRRRGGRVDGATPARLEARLRGTPADRLESALRQLGFAPVADAAARVGLSSGEAGEALEALAAEGRAVLVGDILAPSSLWQATADAAAGLAREFHAAQPLAAGMPRESLRSRLQLAPREFGALMQYAAGAGALVADGETVRAPEHQVRFNPAQQRAADALLAQCRAQPFNTPAVKECRAAVGDAVYEVLLRERRLVQVNADVVFLPDTYDDAVRRVREIIGREGQITAAQFRDAFGTTRKYALALLEHLDQIGVTKRVGDARVLKISGTKCPAPE